MCNSCTSVFLYTREIEKKIRQRPKEESRNGVSMERIKARTKKISPGGQSIQLGPTVTPGSLLLEAVDELPN